MVGELDTALCADPDLAELPGRFLFALDDGRGDVASLAFDLGYRAVDDDQGLLVRRRIRAPGVEWSPDAMPCRR